VSTILALGIYVQTRPWQSEKAIHECAICRRIISQRSHLRQQRKARHEYPPERLRVAQVRLRGSSEALEGVWRSSRRGGKNLSKRGDYHVRMNEGSAYQHSRFDVSRGHRHQVRRRIRAVGVHVSIACGVSGQRETEMLFCKYPFEVKRPSTE
jgi:hypothetical protein